MNTQRKNEFKKSAEELVEAMLPYTTNKNLLKLARRTLYDHMVNAYEKGVTDEIVKIREEIINRVIK